MSFLDELKTRKIKLRETETVVTTAAGQRYVEGKTDIKLTSTHGFVIDTKPDNVPALVTNYLYIGSQDCTDNNVLTDYNIKRVLSLGIKVNLFNVLHHKYIECLDIPETDIIPILSESLPYIRAGVQAMDNILVHCNAGVSRTSMVAIAYLMHYECMPFQLAYSSVKEKRPAVQPNDGFRKQLSKLLPGSVI